MTMSITIDFMTKKNTVVIVKSTLRTIECYTPFQTPLECVFKDWYMGLKIFRMCIHVIYKRFNSGGLALSGSRPKRTKLLLC